MIYPIVAYGDPVLKKVAQNIQKDDPGLDLPKLIQDMYETMYEASGVGLAAPQIGLGIRLFIVDTDRMEDSETGIKKVFINAQILAEEGEKWAFQEGCLSIPNIREDVYRKPKIRLKYFDENWQEHEETYEGVAARVIQHEYDHIEGKLFIDHLSSLKKTLLKSKLSNISKGNVKVDYRMKFPAQK
ncbi:MAG: peptide deformylase [Microscillaceae bacterium]|jgi:peptide deformylase|nr:peptide deformylase [Microscillaceae bacterium]